MICFDNLSPFKQSQSSWFYLEKVSKFHFNSYIPDTRILLCTRVALQCANCKGTFKSFLTIFFKMSNKNPKKTKPKMEN